MTTRLAPPRQPFAQLNGARLQNLTSLKNRQNALPTTLTAPTKRKAQTYDFDNDDSENIDPLFLSPKKAKLPYTKDPSFYTKPTNYFLTPAAPTASSIKPTPRRTAPAPRINTTTLKSTPLSAPAGRSPTRKRIGILNRRRTAGGFTRVDPPKFAPTSTYTSLGFSIDAALSGTIPSYTPRPQVQQPQAQQAVPDFDVAKIPVLYTETAKDSWNFAIYEDTEEELAHNLMEHGACTLDISSDEENSRREKDERGKENVAPFDDISQTRSITSSRVEVQEQEINDIKVRAKAERRRAQEGEIEIDRSPLGDLAASDFYAEGCDEGSFYHVADEEHEAAEEHNDENTTSIPALPASAFDFEVEAKGKGKEIDPLDLPRFDIESLMAKDTSVEAPGAKLLEPMEKAEENFDVWESGSAKGDM